MKPLSIIGLDPGTTIGCAVLDLDGKIIKIFSGKNYSLSDIINKVIEVSQPLITATDKGKVPSLVEEFSRKLGTELVWPEEDMKKEEKRLFAFDFKNEFNNDHESDALAAALFAYKKYSHKLKKINRFLENNDLEEKETEFVKIAIKENLHFSLIKDILTKPEEEKKIIESVIKEEKITKKDFLKLYEKLSYLENEKKRLIKINRELKARTNLFKKMNKSLDKKSSNFDKRVDNLLGFKEQRMKLQSKEIEKQKEIIVNFVGEKDEMYRFMAKIPDYQLLKKLGSLSKKEFLKKNKILQIKENDLLFVNNPNTYSEFVINELAGKSIVVVSFVKPGKTIKNNFLTTTLDKDEISSENNHFALIDVNILEKKINQKDFIEGLITNYRKERR